MRAFKTEFHNGESEKNIVVMSVLVKNGKRFKELDQAGKAALVDCLVAFRKQVTVFTAEVIKSMSETPKKRKAYNSAKEMIEEILKQQ